jgi:hypothetical protein
VGKIKIAYKILVGKPEGKMTWWIKKWMEDYPMIIGGSYRGNKAAGV